VVDVALLFGRLLLLALLFLFLFAAIRTGLNLVVSGAPKRPTTLGLLVTAGPPELKGVKVALDRPVRIGRDPDFELVIADDFVSTKHAQIVPEPDGAVIEDLGSTNGTVLNGGRLDRPTALAAGDDIEIGTVKIRVVRL
jgi:pSer/pThr/pTyr-binding forkhead associated (FHA) protein